MDFGFLFTSLEGRINRKPYWIGTLILVLINVVLTVALGALLVFGIGMDPAAAGDALSLLLTLIMFALSVPIVVKRLHDRNKSAHHAWLLYGPAILFITADAAGMTDIATKPHALVYVLAVATVSTAVWFFIELGFLRGSAGPNRYGPDPLVEPAPAR